MGRDVYASLALRNPVLYHRQLFWRRKSEMIYFDREIDRWIFAE